VFFVIASVKDQRPLGYLQLANMDFVHGTADLGICVDEAARGTGCAAEALLLLEEYARDVFNLRKIILRVLASNSRAIAFYRKARYQKVGLHRRHFYQRQVYYDVLIMEKFLARSRTAQL
jgi:RimJ/RimL family protein N-acetyltransferase